jgi:hypothetical protein
MFGDVAEADVENATAAAVAKAAPKSVLFPMKNSYADMQMRGLLLMEFFQNNFLIERVEIRAGDMRC